MRKILFVLLALACASLPAAAQFRAADAPFPVMGPVLGMDAAGNFVAVRTEHGPAEWSSVTAQRYDPRGTPQGSLIGVVAGFDLWALSVELVVAPQGHFAVMWRYDQWGYYESSYRLYDRTGQALSGALLSADDVRRVPLGAADASGNIVFVYDDSFGVHATVIDPLGTTRVEPFILDGPPETNWRSLGVIADWAGGFTVFWTSSSGKWARRFYAGGQPVGMPFHVEEFTHVAGGPRGEFVLAWLAPDAEGDSVLWGRRYGTSRTALGDPFQVSTTTAQAPGRDGVAIDARGDVTFTWTQPDALGFDVAYARRYRADGTAYGLPFRVDPAPEGTQTDAQALCEPVGHCLFVWLQPWPPEIRAQRYTVQPGAQPAKGDFDGDLRTDLVLRDTDSGEMRWWTMVDGVRTSNVPVWGELPEMNWSYAGDGDFDGDGLNDFVFRHDANGVPRFWLLGGAAGNEVRGDLPLYGVSALPKEWALAATGDFTFDGWPDLVFQHRVDGRLQVWRMAGALYTATLVPTPAGPADPNWVVVAAQDWNGDGTRDLLFFNTTSGKLVQWLLDPGLSVVGGRFTNPSSADDPAWKVVASGDYGVGAGGAAGTADIVWRHDVTGRQVLWYLDTAGNRTSGVFTNPMAPSNPALVACGPR